MCRHRARRESRQEIQTSSIEAEQEQRSRDIGGSAVARKASLKITHEKILVILFRAIKLMIAIDADLLRSWPRDCANRRPKWD
jgi:hypothetical protein